MECMNALAQHSRRTCEAKASSATFHPRLKRPANQLSCTHLMSPEGVRYSFAPNTALSSGCTIMTGSESAARRAAASATTKGHVWRRYKP